MALYLLIVYSLYQILEIGTIFNLHCVETDRHSFSCFLFLWSDPRSGLSKLFYPRPFSKCLRLCRTHGFCCNHAFCHHNKTMSTDGTQAIGCVFVPKKLNWWRLKFEHHIIFIGHEIILWSFWAIYKWETKIKTKSIPSSRAVQNQTVIWI